MRSITLATAVLLVALTAACSSAGDHGAGVPLTAATPAPAAPSDEPSATTAAPSPAGSQPASGTRIGPFGLGALRLGMTYRQAEATGLLTHVRHEGDSWEATLRGSAKAKVLISTRSGVEVIDAYGAIRTPEGVHIGSTRAAVKAAYPSWKNVTGPDLDGRGYGPAAGNPAAWYRIVTYQGKVVELALQLRHQHFYE
jgi:hypothetical protein